MVNKITVAVIVIAIVAIAGAGTYAAITTYGHGTLSLSAADVPVNGNVSAVYLTFSEISLHSTSTGWTNYTMPSRTVDIYGVTLNNSSFLGSLSILAGNYTMVRVYVSAVSVVVADTNESFNISSHSAFLNHPFNVRAFSTTHLTFEFNLNQCLNLNSKVFTPYIGVVVSQ